MSTPFKDEFITQAIYRMEKSTEMISKCLDQLSEEDMWLKPNDATNSVANLILHLCGNITQYAISSLGEQKDIREREVEFSTTDGYTKSELKTKLTTTVDKAIQTMNTCTEQQLLKVRGVQGYTFSGIGIITHVVEHYSYHTGQIALWTKILKNKDLGFYKGIDLNITN